MAHTLPFGAYEQSKTANIYMANEVERRGGPRDLHRLSVHYGGIWTDLQVHVPEKTMRVWKHRKNIRKGMKSVKQGAVTTVCESVDWEWEWQTGRCLESCQKLG